MNTVAICTVLLAAVTLVTGEGGAISVFNNGIYRSGIYLNYCQKNELLQDVKEYDSPVFPGETKTIEIPEEAESTQFFIRYISAGGSFDAHISKPLKMCFKTWGTLNDPHILQVQCNSTGPFVFMPGVGGAISVFNNATFGSKVSIDYELKDRQGLKKQHKESPISSGAIQTIAIPARTKDIHINLASPKADHILFNARFSKAVQLCLKIWGTADDPQSGQIGC